MEDYEDGPTPPRSRDDTWDRNNSDDVESDNNETSSRNSEEMTTTTNSNFNIITDFREKAPEISTSESSNFDKFHMDYDPEENERLAQQMRNYRNVADMESFRARSQRNISTSWEREIFRKNRKEATELKKTLEDLQSKIQASSKELVGGEVKHDAKIEVRLPKSTKSTKGKRKISSKYPKVVFRISARELANEELGANLEISDLEQSTRIKNDEGKKGASSVTLNINLLLPDKRYRSLNAHGFLDRTSVANTLDPDFHELEIPLENFNFDDGKWPVSMMIEMKLASTSTKYFALFPHLEYLLMCKARTKFKLVTKDEGLNLLKHFCKDKNRLDKRKLPMPPDVFVMDRNQVFNIDQKLKCDPNKSHGRPPEPISGFLLVRSVQIKDQIRSGDAELLVKLNDDELKKLKEMGADGLVRAQNRSYFAYLKKHGVDDAQLQRSIRSLGKSLEKGGNPARAVAECYENLSEGFINNVREMLQLEHQTTTLSRGQSKLHRTSHLIRSISKSPPPLAKQARMGEKRLSASPKKSSPKGMKKFFRKAVRKASIFTGNFTRKNDTEAEEKS
mmetsp:Transcript_3092/g.5736  ORF Transcript_3092/g.5736 Transcript_3092/m.5736 type:complete len:564 (+) Transcript_3092:51-1742(+)